MPQVHSGCAFKIAGWLTCLKHSECQVDLDSSSNCHVLAPPLTTLTGYVGSFISKYHRCIPFLSLKGVHG